MIKGDTKDLAGKVNHEKLDKGADKEIKKQILKLDFDDITLVAAEANLISKDFLKNTTDNAFLVGRHKFIFCETTESNIIKSGTDANSGRTDNLKKYFQNLRNVVEKALNIPRIIKEFNKRIGWIDGKTNDEDKTNLPRYEKLIRLKRSYNLLVTMSLQIINNYYWVDISKGEQSTKYNLEDCIRLASPLIIYLKDHFENEVSEELEFDTDENELLKKYKL